MEEPKGTSITLGKVAVIVSVTLFPNGKNGTTVLAHSAEKGIKNVLLEALSCAISYALKNSYPRKSARLDAHLVSDLRFQLEVPLAKHPPPVTSLKAFIIDITALVGSRSSPRGLSSL